MSLNLKISIKGLFSTMSLLFLSGCIYDPMPIILEEFPETKETKCFLRESEDIFLTAYAMDSKESKKYFSSDLPSKGYIPIHLHIENKSPDSYVIRPNFIGLKLVQIPKISKSLHYNTFNFTAPSCYISFLFFWPLTFW